MLPPLIEYNFISFILSHLIVTFLDSPFLSHLVMCTIFISSFLSMCTVLGILFNRHVATYHLISYHLHFAELHRVIDALLCCTALHHINSSILLKLSMTTKCCSTKCNTIRHDMTWTEPFLPFSSLLNTMQHLTIRHMKWTGSFFRPGEAAWPLQQKQKRSRSTHPSRPLQKASVPTAHTDRYSTSSHSE